MPKSKRNKLVTLSKVKKKTKEWKEGVIANVRKAADEYPAIYVLKYQNMRNDKLKELREELRESSRFIFGSTKVMRVALGQSESDEHLPGLAELSDTLKGNVGLLFTRLEREQVLDIFDKWESVDYARAGSKATEDFSLDAGPLENPNGPIPHTIEPLLRQHKLPVKLNRGVVELLADHTVCSAGQRLSSDQAAILRLFLRPMSSFKFLPIACWQKDGGRFEILAEGDEDSEGDLEDATFDSETIGAVPVPGLPAGYVPPT